MGHLNVEGYYRSELTVYTTHLVHVHSRRRSVWEMEREGGEHSWWIVWKRWCSAHRQAPNSAGQWTGTCHLECEAAGVILRDTVRWSGWPCLRSAQLLVALIFNRCLRSQPAKSSHMPDQENQSKDPAAGPSTTTHTLTHTHSQLLEGAHTQTTYVLNPCH